MRLKDKVAIVAAGAQGIGEGISICLAQEGADIAVLDINGDAAVRAAEKVKAMGRKAVGISADLTLEDQVNKAVKDAADFFGRIDILVNNVGSITPDITKRVEEYAATLRGEVASVPHMRFSPDVWDRYYQLNLKSHVMLSNAVTPYFIKQRSGSIVNISSVAGRLPEHSHIPYATMKAADISLTWSLARGLAKFNITANCVCPGFVYTPTWEKQAKASLDEVRHAMSECRKAGGKLPRALKKFAEEDLESMTPHDFWLKFNVFPYTPLRREQTVEDIGRSVVYFVSDDGKNVTGQVLMVDGGQIMR
jgi:NAD(P)-dependent dehydrogenase (short-subunit alcohol dehydrogenase family)